MEKIIKKAVDLIRESHHITAFTGAGISVESGIPPFRGINGLWSKYNPDVLDLSYLYQHPSEAWFVIKEIFYDFFGMAKPNFAHLFLAKLEEFGFLKSVITQNIDNLHQEAGSKVVHEFHGTASYFVCTRCDYRDHSKNVVMNNLPPLCPVCKGLLKPDFVFFGEGIPQKVYAESLKEAQVADLFIIIGTTGQVMPACNIPHVAKRNGCTIIEINPELSAFSNSITDVYLQGNAVDICRKLAVELEVHV